MSISRRNLWQQIIGTFMLLALAASVQAQTILRVDGDNGSPSGDGSSWTDAYKYLQDAIAFAFQTGGPFQIWVAATEADNPYRPDQSATNPDGTRDRHATFELHSGISMFGGFLGLDHPSQPEDDVADANPEVNTTVLTGTQPPSGPPPQCGDPGAGDCFEPDGNGTPGCDDPYCCAVVCAVSPFCCMVEW